MEGNMAVQQEHELGKRDSARIEGHTELELTARDDVFFMLIDLP